jgi:hypothetical protein
MVGVVNVASAITYYTATSGTLTLNGTSLNNSVYTDVGASAGATTTITAADVIVVQGTNALTISTTAATLGGLQITGTGTITVSVALTINGPLTIAGGTFNANAAVTINGTSFTTFTQTGTSSGTTLNCNTTGMYVGQFLTKVAGTGVFSGNTFVTKIINSTSCLVNATPTTAFVNGDTYKGFAAGAAITMTGGTFSLASTITANIYGDLTIGTGAVYQHLGTANTNLWGNLIMTGGAIGNQTSNTSSSTFQLYGNLAGNASASARGWGTFQQRSASTYTFRFSFNRSLNFGAGGEGDDRLSTAQKYFLVK